MAVKQIHYEEVLAECSDYRGALALLKQFRPYLEMIPSMRRPQESIIPIPLPLIRMRKAVSAISIGQLTAGQMVNSASTGLAHIASGEVMSLPADLAILMCDPEWKIKTGVELFIFIHRPQEDFSGLLSRWRQTQIWLNQGYEWLMPRPHEHILSEGAEETHPLFVIFPETHERVRRGLRGANLPFVVQTVYPLDEDWETSIGLSNSETLSTED